MASLENLTIYRGATTVYNCVAKKNGAVIDYTGGTVRMTAKYQYRDLDNAAVFTLTFGPGNGITGVDSTQGTFYITISPAVLAALPPHAVPLVYDIRLTDLGGDIHVLAYGNLTVLPNVTITTP